MGLSDDIKDPVSNKTLQKVYDTLLHSQNVIRKIGKLEITEEHIKTIKRLMEKKTKKMTKAEAFEWLKETKVRCYEERSNALYANLVVKMTACGCEYDGFVSPPTASVWAVVVDNEGKIYHLPTKNANNYDSIDFKEIHADDILSIEIIEDTKPDCERNEHVKALQELIAKSGCIDCIIISKNDIGVLKK